MTVNADGTATCDRCLTAIPGYGVHYGMVCTDITSSGVVRQLIFCYVNNCRGVVLASSLIHTAAINQAKCVHCNVTVPRAAAEAMIAVDLTPTDSQTPRTLLFCYVNGGRDALLVNNVRGQP